MQLISKNGTTNLTFGIIGFSKNPQLGDKNNATYKKFDDFIKDKSPKQTRYEVGFRIESDEKTDKKMADAGKEAAASFYFVIAPNCMDAVQSGLKAGGFQLYQPGIGEDLYPNQEYEQIKEVNKGKEINLDQEREKVNKVEQK